jgi:hypothetical protein
MIEKKEDVSGDNVDKEGGEDENEEDGGGEDGDEGGEDGDGINMDKMKAIRRRTSLACLSQ